MICENEHEAERELKNELEKLDLLAYHMDTNVDGYPDLTVIGRSIVLVEMKHDKSPAKEKTLHQLMETSQPVCIHEMQQVGYNKVLLCIYRKGAFNLYHTDGILRHVMACRSARSLKLICSGDAREVATAILAVVCNG